VDVVVVVVVVVKADTAAWRTAAFDTGTSVRCRRVVLVGVKGNMPGLVVVVVVWTTAVRREETKSAVFVVVVAAAVAVGSGA
jgi:hypothetical protein